jgi:type II secretory pathway pseudopilin PulG
MDPTNNPEDDLFSNNTTAAAFIGASVTLVLIIIFMILMVILVRQCVVFMAKRNAIRQQLEQQREARAELERQRRLSISEPVDPTFDWHHSIRIAGTPPPTYREAKDLPPIEDNNDKQEEVFDENHHLDNNLKINDKCIVNNECEDRNVDVEKTEPTADNVNISQEDES